MSTYNSGFLVALLVALLELAASSGSLEVRLISSRSCNVKLCVKKPQAKPLDSCLLESQLISLQSQQQRVVSTPFHFPFPDTFVLVTELYDTQGGQLSQNTSKERFAVDNEFTPAVGSSDFLDIAFRASCHPSYFGTGCQRYCKSSISYTCDSEGRKICAEGWKGEQCDQPICLEGCKHGRCVEPGRCECDHGFFGSTCAECRRSENCRHGTCRDNQPFTCACEQGWGGIYCERDLEYCARHRPCKSGGVCVNGGVRTDFTCQCPEGFVGATCEIELPSICEHPGICRNGGVCTDVDTKLGRCVCADGFEGRYCERRKMLPLCTATSCKNGGSCFGGANCACPQCFSGADCSIIDEKCLWQRANVTQASTASTSRDDVGDTKILMLMALASIMMLASCVVVFFLKYKKMKRILRDPVTQNSLNEHRQIHELPNRSIDNRSPDEVYKVFVIPSKKSKDVDKPAVEYETRYVLQPRGRYRTLPCVDVTAAEPENHYAEIEYRPTTSMTSPVSSSLKALISRLQRNKMPHFITGDIAEEYCSDVVNFPPFFADISVEIYSVALHQFIYEGVSSHNITVQQRVFSPANLPSVGSDAGRCLLRGALFAAIRSLLPNQLKEVLLSVQLNRLLH
ncbi:hypothetical protein RB195_014628 [Necator americanus]|uniref:Delta-like protein n=1 Tax=Necator americanus TaxID=51031 RepID=A0ABR1E1C0_NECAM